MRLLKLLLVTAALFAQTPDTWTTKELLPAAALADRLQKGEKPIIIYTGPAYLYRVKHIPGAINAGPASNPDGVPALLALVKGKPADTEVVVYCGCCPMRVCLNIRPAIMALKDAGFTKVRLLELPTRFSDDWTSKGYPAIAE